MAYGHDEQDTADTQGTTATTAPRLSLHALARAARRNTRDVALDYVLTYGRYLQRTGVTFCFLARRDIPRADQRTTWAARLEGTVVLLADNGEIVTVYRNRDALRQIERKAKYRLSGGAGAMAPLPRRDGVTVAPSASHYR